VLSVRELPIHAVRVISNNIDDRAINRLERASAVGQHLNVSRQPIGHASIAITMDRYGHLLPALDEAVVTGLEATYHAAQKPANGRVASLPA
jgi:hypothetical protein